MKKLWPKTKEWNKRWDDLKGGDSVRPLLQIHDDLLFEIREEIADLIIPQIKGMMENVIGLSIPITVNVKVGDQWGSMKAWEGKPKREEIKILQEDNGYCD